jgi:hypothetical protein
MSHRALDDLGNGNYKTTGYEGVGLIQLAQGTMAGASEP